MFKNFNHKFVYKYPLIWNTKIVPITLISIVFHLLFFVVGYQNAIVHSVQIHNYYNQESNATTITLFAILISVLVFIIWCVLYFRNNAFKAFYPKTNVALFKEWLLILMVCLLTSSYALSSIVGANAQTRSNVSKEVALKRCETISKASLFLQGSFNEGKWNDSTLNGNYHRYERDSFAFEGKNYALNSLMNKNIESFPFFDSKQDSLRRLEVQRWMKENDKAIIAGIFKDYFDIANEHQLKSNISPEKWMELVYNYPEFTNYADIGRSERELQYEYEHEYEYAEVAVTTEAESETLISDTTSTIKKIINGKPYIYSKYYVSDKVLHKYYSAVATAWENPLVDFTTLLIVAYISFGFSLAVFSFRVTSGKNWLIALIAMGVVQIIFGIGTAFFSFSMTFPILYLLLFLLLTVYFSSVYVYKREKKWSGIVLNQILWMLLGFLPMIYIIVMDYIKETSGYYNRYDRQTRVLIEDFPKIDWFESNGLLLMFINLLIVTFMLFILSRIIKKWRGIPEE